MENYTKRLTSCIKDFKELSIKTQDDIIAIIDKAYSDGYSDSGNNETVEPVEKIEWTRINHDINGGFKMTTKTVKNKLILGGLMVTLNENNDDKYIQYENKKHGMYIKNSKYYIFIKDNKYNIGIVINNKYNYIMNIDIIIRYDIIVKLMEDLK